MVRRLSPTRRSRPRSKSYKRAVPAPQAAACGATTRSASTNGRPCSICSTRTRSPLSLRARTGCGRYPPTRPPSRPLLNPASLCLLASLPLSENKARRRRWRAGCRERTGADREARCRNCRRGGRARPAETPRLKPLSGTWHKWWRATLAQTFTSPSLGVVMMEGWTCGWQGAVRPVRPLMHPANLHPQGLRLPRTKPPWSTNARCR